MSTSCPRARRPVIWSSTKVCDTEGKYVVTTAVRISDLSAEREPLEMVRSRRTGKESLLLPPPQVLERHHHVAEGGAPGLPRRERREEHDDGDAETDDQPDQLVNR